MMALMYTEVLFKVSNPTRGGPPLCQVTNQGVTGLQAGVGPGSELNSAGQGPL